MGGSSYGGPELLGADAYVASLPDPGDAGETAGQPGRGAEPPLNFTGIIGRGAWSSGRRREGPPGRGGLWESQSQLCLQWPRKMGSRRMETISPRKPSGSPRAAWRRSGGVAQLLRSLGTIRKPPSLSERLRRLQRLRAPRAARTQPTGACSSAPSFPSPSDIRNASGGPGTAHRPALGAARDWPDTRCQVAKQRSEP